MGKNRSFLLPILSRFRPSQAQAAIIAAVITGLCGIIAVLLDNRSSHPTIDHPTSTYTLTASPTETPTLTPSPTSSMTPTPKTIQLGRDQAFNKTNTYDDKRGNVLVVGGWPVPTRDGGEASWQIPVDNASVSELSITIFTNGDLWSGKGIHSTTPGECVEIYMDDVIVFTIECTEQQGGNYWPAASPMGSPSYATGSIPSPVTNTVSKFVLRVLAKPYAVLDIASIEVSIIQGG
jgi:hypothetical protein